MVYICIILIGLVLGFLSQFLTKRRDPGAFVTRMIVGLLSAVVGIVLSGIFNIGDSAGIFFEIVVIVVLLSLYQIVFGKRNAS